MTKAFVEGMRNLRVDIDSLRQDYNSLRHDYSDLEQKSNKVFDENKEIQSRQDELIKANEKLANDNAILSNQCSLFMRQNQQLLDKLSLIDDRTNALSEEMRSGFKENKKSLEAMSETVIKVRTMEFDSNKMKNKIDNMANGLGTMETAVMGLRKQIKECEMGTLSNTKSGKDFQMELTSSNDIVKGEEDDENSSTKSDSSNKSLEANLQELKHDELEYDEFCENQKNRNNIFIRINSYLNSDFPKSEISRLIRTWTNDELASAFRTSVLTIRPLKVEKNSSLFIAKLKRNHEKTFKTLLRKNRALIIASPILMRSDLNAITRIKKSVLGLIAKKLRIQEGPKSACQKRLDKKAKLHYMAPDDEAIIVLSYKNAVQRFRNLITEEESKKAYGMLEKSIPESMKRAMLLL